MSRVIKCDECKGEISNDEVALNFKLFGKQIAKLYCYDCLSAILECNTSQLKERARELKRSGCALFKIDFLQKESGDVSHENNISQEKQ